MKFPIEINDPTTAFIVFTLCLILVVGVYFIPSIVAFRRKHRFRALLLLLNVALAFAGTLANLLLSEWAGSALVSLATSGLGWLLLLLWSVFGEARLAAAPART
jgi:hypothetical protein